MDHEPPTPRATIGPAASTPPEPIAQLRFRRESMLPPRAMPATTVAWATVAAATTIAHTIPDARWRAVLVLSCGVVAWVIGYLTPPPRRDNGRRSDQR